MILIWLDGGPPQHETYDPKPDAPAEFRGPLKAIPTAVPGVHVSELLPAHARLMNKMSIIRSMHHDNGDHFAAAHWMLTGYLGSNAANLPAQYPSAGSIIARLKGPRKTGIPAYVGLPTTHSVGLVPGYHGAAYLGVGYNPVRRRRRPEFRIVPGSQPRASRRCGRLREPRAAATCSGPSTAPGATPMLPASWRASTSLTARRFRSCWASEARRAFDLSQEDPRLRDRYGRDQWCQSTLLARRLVEAGVRFVTLTFSGWDFHSSLENGMKRVLPLIDSAIATLIQDLEDRGLLE